MVLPRTENGTYMFIGRLVPALCATLIPVIPSLVYVVHTFSSMQEHQVASDHRQNLLEDNQKEIVRSLKEVTDKMITRVEVDQRASARDREFNEIRKGLSDILQDRKDERLESGEARVRLDNKIEALSLFVYSRFGNIPTLVPNR